VLKERLYSLMRGYLLAGLTNIIVVSENFSVPEGAMKPYLQSFFNITFESDGELRINAVSS